MVNEQVCYWCKHPDHGEKICPAPYSATNEKGITNSYPCGCSRSTILSEAGKETTPLGQYLLRRQGKADRYVGGERAAFFSGWDKAIEEVGLMLQTPGGDGCFCVHHPDDPAHGEDCYDVIQYLFMGGR